MRFWSELAGYSLWSFDFVLYKRGSDKVLGRSEFSVQWPRSVVLSKDLEAGDYILHVRRHSATTGSLTDSSPNQ